MGRIWPFAILAAIFLVAAQQDAPPRIGVVDLNAVFENSEQKTELEKSLTSQRDALKKKMQGIEEKIAKLKSEMELVDRTTSRFKELEKEAFGLTQELNYERKVAAQELGEQMARSQETLLNQIRSTVESYGRAHGYQVILQKELTRSSDTQTWRSVLYRADDVDLTDEILAELNR